MFVLAVSKIFWNCEAFQELKLPWVCIGGKGKSRGCWQRCHQREVVVKRRRVCSSLSIQGTSTCIAGLRVRRKAVCRLAGERFSRLWRYDLTEEQSQELAIARASHAARQGEVRAFVDGQDWSCVPRPWASSKRQTSCGNSVDSLCVLVRENTDAAHV